MLVGSPTSTSGGLVRSPTSTSVLLPSILPDAELGCSHIHEARVSLVSSRAVGRARESLVTPPKQVPVMLVIDGRSQKLEKVFLCSAIDGTNSGVRPRPYNSP